MENESFFFTIFFMTLGPVKIIGPFAKITKQFPLKFKREVAIKAVIIAAGMCLFAALLGQNLVAKYNISVPALEIGAGMVLLISALNTIFPTSQPSNSPSSEKTALQLAISPVASLIIVPPIGVAVILIAVMVFPDTVGGKLTVIKTLLPVLVLDFLVMYFIDKITKLSWLMLMLQVLGSVLVFLQVALGIQAFLAAFNLLGWVKQGLN